jgi:hypothetical protein
MRQATRGFLSHLAGYAAPHVVMACVLAGMAAMKFRPGGESATPFEAVILQLFLSAALLSCSGVGYASALAFVFGEHATLRLPSMFGLVASVGTFTIAAVGTVNRVARDFDVSVFAVLAMLGFSVGLVAAAFVLFAARVFPKDRRA